MKIEYTMNNTKIFDSYKIKDSDLSALVDKIIKERKKMKYKVTRTKDSYIKEIKAHNRLYKLGIKRDHTKDVDLEEPISKSKQLAYGVLGAW